MKKITALLLSMALTLSLTVGLAPTASAAGYTDIPEDSALSGEVRKAVNYGLMNGYSDTKFGYSDSMTRAQFTAILVRMMGWTTVVPETPTYVDVPADHTWYSALETAAAHGVTDYQLDSGKHFRPDTPITRAKMSQLLVQALGLEGAANMLNYNRMVADSEYRHHTPFTDLPEGNEGYISVAYTIGMTKGITETTFGPDVTATRAQAAAMLVRIYEKMQQKTDFVHGFYAISSNSQMDLAEEMDAVSAGWSRMTWDGTTALLATTSENQNEFCIPVGYQDVVNSLHQNKVRLHLNVYMDVDDGAVTMLMSPEGRQQAIEQIINELTISFRALGKNPYDGVTLDVEGLRMAQRENYTAFLRELSAAVHGMGKTMYVCVAPALLTGPYYDGYDYAAIGELADRVILMTHDYETRDMKQFVGTSYYKTAATAPIYHVYCSLRAAVEQIDPSKLLLGFSAKNVAWKIDESGKLLSGIPYYPDMETVARRLAQEDTERGFSETYQQSYAIYRDEAGNRYFLWYQDDASVSKILQTAKLMGITGVSLWRLGTIPDQANWNWNSLMA